jgi:hypothetical protein
VSNQTHRATVDRIVSILNEVLSDESMNDGEAFDAVINVMTHCFCAMLMAAQRLGCPEDIVSITASVTEHLKHNVAWMRQAKELQ